MPGKIEMNAPKESCVTGIRSRGTVEAGGDQAVNPLMQWFVSGAHRTVQRHGQTNEQDVSCHGELRVGEDVCRRDRVGIWPSRELSANRRHVVVPVHAVTDCLIAGYSDSAGFSLSLCRSASVCDRRRLLLDSFYAHPAESRRAAESAVHTGYSNNETVTMSNSHNATRANGTAEVVLCVVFVSRGSHR